jgi:hypothetical protein
MTLLPSPVDPTLEAADIALAEAYNAEPSRGYLGMSSIGRPCSREQWYQFRNVKDKTFSADTIKKFIDGHSGEDVQAERLKAVDGITLDTVDPASGKQFEYNWFNGHFSGHSDGVIIGLLQSPRTKHIWEHKQTNDKKFNEFVKLKEKHGEKGVLKEWDTTYYSQAILYMHFAGINRHYLTVSSAGGRATASCRTEANEAEALRLIDKAERIIFSDSAPARISSSPSWFQCKMCDFSDICHSKAIPKMNCRTCLHSTPEKSGGWSCAIGEYKETGCEKHLYLPDMLSGKIKDVDTGAVVYEDGRINFEGGRVE